jgi:hypothetical protein
VKQFVNLAPTAELLLSDFDCEGHAVLAGNAITFAGTTISGGEVNKGTTTSGVLTSLVGGELDGPRMRSTNEAESQRRKGIANFLSSTRYQ